MPSVLKFITLMGFIAPLLVIASTLTGSVLNGKVVSSTFGAAENAIEFSIVVLSSLPAFIAAVMIVMRSSKSRYLYIIGWITICISPFALSQIRAEYHAFLVQLIFNLILGAIVALFLFKSESINNYFSQKS